MSFQLLLLFSPLLVCSSTQAIQGYDEHYRTHQLEKFGFRLSPYSKHPWTNLDSNRFTLKKFRPAKRFDEAQIQEALASDDETVTRSENEAERRMQLISEELKLRTRLKRSKMKHLSMAGKEYITRLGKRSWTFHRWANGWQPLKTIVTNS